MGLSVCSKLVPKCTSVEICGHVIWPSQPEQSKVTHVVASAVEPEASAWVLSVAKRHRTVLGSSRKYRLEVAGDVWAGTNRLVHVTNLTWWCCNCRRETQQAGLSLRHCYMGACRWLGSCDQRGLYSFCGRIVNWYAEKLEGDILQVVVEVFTQRWWKVELTKDISR